MYVAPLSIDTPELLLCIIATLEEQSLSCHCHVTVEASFTVSEHLIHGGKLTSYLSSLSGSQSLEWKLSNTDTLGTEENALISEVS